MIRGELAIRLNMGILVLTGALLLSLAQQNYVIFGITLIVSVFTLLAIDTLRLLHFPSGLANTMAFVISLLTIGQFFGGDAATKLNAVANLLTYLQLVLLLQKKSPRLYWQVMMLSLLQVVVAAALNLNFGAGVAFIAFVFLTGMAMVHLNEYRTFYQLNEWNHPANARSQNHGQPGTAIRGHLKYDTIGQSIRTGRRFAQQGFMMSLAGIIFAFSVFYSIPRFGSAWYGPGKSTASVTGFATEVKFGDEGFLHQSNELVMRVSFLDDDDIPNRLAMDPYLRGLVLPDYLYRNGYWVWSNREVNHRGLGRRSRTPIQAMPSTVRANPVMKQIIRLEPAAKIMLDSSSDNHLLFSVYPVFKGARTTGDIFYNGRGKLLFRDVQASGQSTNGPYQYELDVPNYRNLGQVPATPLNLNMFSSSQMQDEISRLVGKNRARFETDWKPITKIATKLRQNCSNPQNRRIVANAFLNYLKGEKFSYTRDLGNIQRNESIDPIVDFVINHRSGHCEFFATALALMLRSQDIPCRLVSGFRGGEYNALAGFYDVREKHAHTWVEAILKLEDCEDSDMMETGQVGNAGAWLRLDPTPSVRSENEDFSQRNMVERAGDAIGFAQKIWDDYVMGLDQQSRSSNGFDPTIQPDMEAPLVIAFIVTATSQIQQLLNSVPRYFWYWGVLGLALSFSLIGYFRILSRLKKEQGNPSPLEVIRQLLRSSVQTMAYPARRLWTSGYRRQPPEIHFYEEFCRILQPYGFLRRSNQTQLEFARQVKQQLRSDNEENQTVIHSAIDYVITAFYLVRFGQDSKSPFQRSNSRQHQQETDRQQLRQQLKSLKRALEKASLKKA